MQAATLLAAIHYNDLRNCTYIVALTPGIDNISIAIEFWSLFLFGSSCSIWIGNFHFLQLSIFHTNNSFHFKRDGNVHILVNPSNDI